MDQEVGRKSNPGAWAFGLIGRHEVKGGNVIYLSFASKLPKPFIC